MTEGEARIEEILGWWFGDLAGPYDLDRSRFAIWFSGGPDFDREVRDRFGDDVERAIRGELDHWKATPRGRLALVILLDQLTRNVFRDSPRAFEGDPRALAATREAIARGEDRELRVVERQFLYMPLMHAEDREAQDESLRAAAALREELPEAEREKFAGYFHHAEKHAAVVQRFGRYPHRNAVLGRESTPEELAFMEEHGRGF